MSNHHLISAESPESWADKDKPWRILVVDDDPEVIAVTRLVAQDMMFENRPIEVIEATTAKQAKLQLLEHPDIAVIVLDVVMETDDAGLNLVKAIRGEMKNPSVRILLRTGQPGQAPEREVILDYDINDYRLKSDLTAQSLFSSLISGLRSYQMVCELEFHQKLAFQTLSQQLEFEDQLIAMIDQPALHTDVMAFVTGANQAMGDLMGHRASEMLGLDVASLLPQPLAEAIKKRKITKDQIGILSEDRVEWTNAENETVTATVKTKVFRMGENVPAGLIVTLSVT